MHSPFRKFLAFGTLLCLAATPAMSQDRPSASESGKPAHMGEIRAQDVEIYTQRMRAAIQITDRKGQDAAVTAARLELAQRTRKPITTRTIAELDGLLDLGGISPQLGATG